MKERFEFSVFKTGKDSFGVSLDRINTRAKEVIIPDTFEGRPVTHIGCNTEYEAAHLHWVDYHHFKEEYVPERWWLICKPFTFPSSAQRVYIPSTVRYITRYVRVNNKNAEFIISDDNPDKKCLLETLQEAMRK